MESQKVEREKCQDETYKFLPLFIRQKDVVTSLRFRGRGPSGAVLKVYNFSENSIIHKFSRKIIKLNKGPHFGFKSIFCRIPNQKKKYIYIDLNPYNNKTLHCLLRFKVEKITDFDELKIVKKLFRAG